MHQLGQLLIKVNVASTEQRIFNLNLRHCLLGYLLHLLLILLRLALDASFLADHVLRRDCASVERLGRRVSTIPEVLRHEVASRGLLHGFFP